jgi:hypothetical protein
VAYLEADPSIHVRSACARHVRQNAFVERAAHVPEHHKSTGSATALLPTRSEHTFTVVARISTSIVQQITMSLTAWLASSFFILQLLSTGTLADGTGLIGFGKTLYDPTCTFACRNVIRKQKLACTPSSSTENHGTAHNPVSTPPKCFVEDPTFLKTMALCIDVFCTLSDKPTMELITDYWASHLGTGTLGDYQYRPIMSYPDALKGARMDEAKVNGNATKSTPVTVPHGLVSYQVSSPLGLTIGGSAALNQTRLVDPVQWQLQWNYLSDFETNERGHSMMT